MAFRNYLEGEDDAPYYKLNSLAHYYEEMERYAALIKEMTGYIKAYGNELGLTKEEIDNRVTAYILQNKVQLDQRLGEWDEKLQKFDGSVTDLLTEWVDDGTLNHIIDTTLIDQKVAPLAQQMQGYTPKRANTVAAIGDSISWRNKIKNYNAGNFAVNTGWFHWANAALDHRMIEASNLAVSGKRTDEMVLEQLPVLQALTNPPGWCTVLGGANDIIQNRTAFEIQTSLYTLYNGLENKGIGVIASTMTPQTGLTTEQKNNIYRVNRWIKNQATTRKGFILVDWFTHMSDVSGDPLPGVLVDNVHQSAKGAAIMGHVFADAVKPFMPTVDLLPLPGDFANTQPNPFKNEEGSGYLGAVQDNRVAYNYRLATADTTTLVVEPSLVDRNDGIPGKLQRIMIASGNARLTNASLIQALPNQRWVATAELFISPEVRKTVSRISLVLSESGGSKQAFTLDRDPDVDDGEGAGLTALPEKLILRTPVLTTGTGTTGLYTHVRIYGGTNGGFINIGRQSVEQLPLL